MISVFQNFLMRSLRKMSNGDINIEGDESVSSVCGSVTKVKTFPKFLIEPGLLDLEVHESPKRKYKYNFRR